MIVTTVIVQSLKIIWHFKFCKKAIFGPLNDTQINACPLNSDAQIYMIQIDWLELIDFYSKN